jgi:hypothetical protein
MHLPFSTYSEFRRCFKFTGQVLCDEQESRKVKDLGSDRHGSLPC